VLLSQVLKEYCRHCEERPERLKQKEVYERALRGQRPAEIAQAMDITRNSVDQHLHRARKWIMERVRQADVHHSVFSSLQCL
jgi:DNA-directed RNA polymerase specialized sigma24 family protein